MDGDLDAALQHWKDAGPLSPESLKLMLDCREVNMGEQSGELIFAAFVRSLTAEQRSTQAGVMELVDRDEAFRWF